MVEEEMSEVRWKGGYEKKARQEEGEMIDKKELVEFLDTVIDEFPFIRVFSKDEDKASLIEIRRVVEQSTRKKKLVINGTRIYLYQGLID